MEDLRLLVNWAKDKDVELNGIKPVEIPGRGIGIVSTRRLKKGERILMVPHQAILSLDTVPQNISRKLPSDMSIHSLLTLDLVLNKVVESTPSNAIMPDSASFQKCIPFMWPKELQDLLPNDAKPLLKNQQAKLHHDWEIISAAFPSLHYNKYLYAWFLINTRTFLHDTSRTEGYPWEDRLALLPIADLFNHAETGCQMTHWPERYVITTDRKYPANEELFISYGDHPNDLLLVEYGFLLAENSWDKVCIDELLLSRLNEEQKSELERRHLLGDYSLKAETGACYRTQAALRLLCLTRSQWLDFINEKNDGNSSKKEVEGLLLEVLSNFLGTIKQTYKTLGKLQTGLEFQRELLTQRWKQIEAIVQQTMKPIKFHRTDGSA